MRTHLGCGDRTAHCRACESPHQPHDASSVRRTSRHPGHCIGVGRSLRSVLVVGSQRPTNRRLSNFIKFGGHLDQRTVFDRTQAVDADQAFHTLD